MYAFGRIELEVEMIRVVTIYFYVGEIGRKCEGSRPGNSEMSKKNRSFGCYFLTISQNSFYHRFWEGSPHKFMNSFFFCKKTIE